MLYIGADNPAYPGYELGGYLDEICIYDLPLTATQVSQLAVLEDCEAVLIDEPDDPGDTGDPDDTGDVGDTGDETPEDTGPTEPGDSGQSTADDTGAPTGERGGRDTAGVRSAEGDKIAGCSCTSAGHAELPLGLSVLGLLVLARRRD